MRQFLLGMAGSAMMFVGASAQRSIEDLAPSSSFFVFRADNLGESVGQLKRGRLWQTLHSPDFAPMIAPQMEQLSMQVEMMEQMLGLDAGSIDFPRGPLGAAFFTAPDAETGLDSVGVMLSIDCAGNESMVAAFLDMMLEQLSAQGEEVGETQIAGHTFHTLNVDMNLPTDELGAMGGLPIDPGATLEAMFAGMKKMHVGRVGETLLAGSDGPALADAVGALSGDSFKSIGTIDAYSDAILQVGGGDINAVLLPAAAAKALAADPQLMFIMPILGMPMGLLGLDNVRAFGVSADVGDENFVAVSRLGILMEGEKRGLPGLLDTETTRGGVPGFVSADTASYAHLNVEFGGVMGLVNQMLRMVPPELGGDIEGFMIEYGPDLQGGFNSLGTDVHFSQLADGGMVGAIACKDTNRLLTILSKYAPMIELSPRDFLGHTIFSGDFAPVALGVGGGHLFISTPEGVESALRATSAASTATLDRSQVFRHALSHLPDGKVVAWGYSDTAMAIESALAIPNMAGIDAPEVPAGVDSEMLSQFLGPQVWELHAVDDGFLLTSYMLTPPKR